MPGPAVIDLGVVGEHTAAPSPPAVRRPAARYRAAAAALVAAVALAVPGASAPAPPPALRPVADIAVPLDHSPWSLGAADLAVLAPDPARPGVTTLTSYSLADGAARWSADTVPTATDLQRWPERRMLFSVDGSGRTTAWDAATGARLWAAPGSYQGTVAGLVLLAADPAAPDELHVVDPVTGRAAWSFTAAGYGSAAFDEAGGSADAARVVLVGADGTTTLRRLSDGAEVLRGRVDRGVHGDTFVALAGDGLLHTAQTFAGGTAVSAYRLETLAPLWRRTLDGQQNVSPCGPLLCLGDGEAVRAIDRRTGGDRWVNEDWSWASLLPPDRLLGDAGMGGGADYGLLDPATGGTLADLGDAVLGVGEDTLALRPDRADAGRTVVSHFDAAGRVAPIGAVGDALPEQCAAAGAYLACPTVARTLRVWRLGPPPGPGG